MNFRISLRFLIFSMLFCAAVAWAQVAPTTQFELDGTAGPISGPGSDQNCTYGVCDFWNLINGNGTGGAAGNSVARTFISGEASTLSFTGGGSKDPSDLTSWACSSSPTPDKDTLTNGYAAAYEPSDLVLAFGADRLSTNGDANIGIWFFQQNVSCNPATGKFVQANGSPAKHALGDVFVVSAFTGGGTTPNISVYIWNPSCASAAKNPTPGKLPGSCAASNLQVIFNQAAACYNGGTPNSSAACAITNSGTVQVDWPYPSSASSTPSSVPAQALFSGGLDLTYLIQTFSNLGSVPCFSSFLEETRSSQTPSSVLKDFLGGQFQLCSISITKSCDLVNNPPTLINNGTSIQYTWTGTVKNTGVGTLTNVTVNDTLSGATVTGPALTTLTAGQSTTYSVTYQSTQTPVTNTATASGSFGGQTISSGTAQAACSFQAQSSITVTKHCAAPGPGLSCTGSGCVVQVPVTATVCNTGATQLTNIQLQDYPGALSPGITPNGFTLNPGACTGTTGNPANPSAVTQPTSADPASTGNSNGRYLFDDSISVTSATPAVGPALSPVAGCTNSTDLACSSVQCPLCPQGECSTSPLP